MPGETNNMLLCYNRGCGQTFEASQNKEDSCTFHSGEPFFHDAYKGWTCCKKKSTDFTEFLNIKGCTKSYHSNVKPPEPEKPAANKELENVEVIECRAPVPPLPIKVDRPPFDTPLVTLKAQVSAALRQQLEALIKCDTTAALDIDNSVALGTNCKNNGCKQIFEGPESSSTNSSCKYHPGMPVFHEGLKYWSCCVKRTTDFNVFLEQVGCATGSHVWHKAKSLGAEGNEVKCRMDWHQTPSCVYVSVFGKKYDPDSSVVQLSPVRLKFNLYFPEENGVYSKDLELRGVIDVGQSSVSMLPTKVEIKLRKSEPGSWSHLDFPKKQCTSEESKVAKSLEQPESNLVSKVNAVDLSDL